MCFQIQPKATILAIISLLVVALVTLRITCSRLDFMFICNDSSVLFCGIVPYNHSELAH